MGLSLRLAIMFTPVLVWGVLYLTSRFGGISPTRFMPWLRAGFVVLMGVSLILFVFDVRICRMSLRFMLGGFLARKFGLHATTNRKRSRLLLLSISSQ
jgi:hypothetical protein